MEPTELGLGPRSSLPWQFGWGSVPTWLMRSWLQVLQDLSELIAEATVVAVNLVVQGIMFLRQGANFCFESVNPFFLNGCRRGAKCNRRWRIDLFPLEPLPLPFPFGLSGEARSVMRTSKTMSLTLRENLVLVGGGSKTKVQQKQPAAR